LGAESWLHGYEFDFRNGLSELKGTVYTLAEVYAITKCYSRLVVCFVFESMFNKLLSFCYCLLLWRAT